MKAITIPTSFSDIKKFYKVWTSKRYRNNCEVLISLRDDIKTLVKNDYWKKDISETMLNRVFLNPGGELDKLFNIAIKFLK